MENLVDTLSKSKSIIIDGDTHKKFKNFCRGKNYKIGGVIESLIELYLDNPKTIQKLIDDVKDKNNHHDNIGK